MDTCNTVVQNDSYWRLCCRLSTQYCTGNFHKSGWFLWSGVLPALWWPWNYPQDDHLGVNKRPAKIASRTPEYSEWCGFVKSRDGCGLSDYKLKEWQWSESMQNINQIITEPIRGILCGTVRKSRPLRFCFAVKYFPKPLDGNISRVHWSCHAFAIKLKLALTGRDVIREDNNGQNWRRRAEINHIQCPCSHRTVCNQPRFTCKESSIPRRTTTSVPSKCMFFFCFSVRHLL